MTRRCRLVLATLIMAIWASAVAAQSILLVNPELVFERSQFGQQIITANRMDRDFLRAREQRISADFVLEEQTLAAQREELSAEAFQALTVDFDRRVQAARAEQERLGTVLSTRIEVRSRAFADALNEVNRQIILEAGADMVMDRRNIIAANPALDISARVIEQLDRLDHTLPTDMPSLDVPEPGQ